MTSTITEATTFLETAARTALWPKRLREAFGVVPTLTISGGLFTWTVDVLAHRLSATGENADHAGSMLFDRAMNLLDTRLRPLDRALRPLMPEECGDWLAGVASRPLPPWRDVPSVKTTCVPLTEPDDRR